ncbi:MAG TPA: MBL fold metallo-hydrolase [bacterium]|nr:MBL fold metallo-hydrolase [bacterium]
MKVRFCGGTRTVTGSKHLLTSGKQRLLLECGLFQGHRAEAEHTNRSFPFKAREINWSVISHAHIDHVGNIPNLVKFGFRGPLLMTQGTVALSRLLVEDSAHIQESDIRYLNKKLREKGEPPKEPIYTAADAEESLKYLEGMPYAKPRKLGPFKVVLHDAGHILGSALVDIEVEGKRVLFTGDLGRKKMPIINDPVQVAEADYLIMEGTYGNRKHGDYSDVDERLAGIVNRVYARGGRIVVPAFAVERSQEIVYTLNRLRQSKRIPEVPVYVDSPLASRVTEVYRNYPQYYDAEALQMLNGHRYLFDFPGLRYIESVEDSKALNVSKEPCIIISASGMCEAGRVLHHLKYAVEDPKNLVLIVSFQAENTLGRRIAERQPVVRIYGEEHPLRAEVEVMDEFSAHADHDGLIQYVSAMNISRLKKVFIVHSELEAATALVEPLKRLGVREVLIPEIGEEHEF